jgi:hypothetical protein
MKTEIGPQRREPHCKEKCRKFEANIPRKGISEPQSQFPHSCVCVWEYINRSQTHECGNWG